MIDREQVSAAVTVLRLDHGPVSAMDLELLEALRAAVAKCAADDSAIVITGTGRAFSAGVDLRRILDGGAGYLDRYLPVLTGAFEDVLRYRRPVVAAANGHAIAGGCVLVCCADIRLMAAGTGRIGVPELLVGVPFPAMGLAAVRIATGDRGIEEIIYTGATYLPEEAQRRGLIDEVVPEDELLERAIARAEQLAAIPSAAYWQTKRALRGPVLDHAAGEESRRSDEEMARTWKSPESAAAIAAYVEKTLGERRRS
ncbi:MAG: enoyl-CoA hydratase/isomerase family protein [Acidimicrobiia bacterium]